MKYQTKLLSWPEEVDEGARLLMSGECVAVPTETVFGLAADASDPMAVKRIFEAKQRPSDHPLIVHILDKTQIPLWATDVPDSAYALADAFWPGPLSLLLPKHPDVNTAVTGGRSTVVLRSPAHPAFRRLLEKSGLGLAAPSANRYKSVSPTRPEHVLHTLAGRIPAVVNDGAVDCGIESTILDLTQVTPTILRPGPVSAQEIERVLGREVHYAQQDNAAAPGNKQQHYQPSAKAEMLGVEHILTLVKQSEKNRYGVLAYSAGLRQIENQVVGFVLLEADSAGYAAGLYDALHRLDQQGVEQILIERPPSTAAWRAINDRLARAVA